MAGTSPASTRVNAALPHATEFVNVIAPRRERWRSRKIAFVDHVNGSKDTPMIPFNNHKNAV
jgi:hypothetical protein